ncbi:N-acetylmuramidase family protein [Niabella sp. 22666]|uniref:N-acetylmuramidase family protein n=1 Tax=Niabella sp. 22666 TaxID=3453954 RepID=UPI003F84B27B
MKNGLTEKDYQAAAKLIDCEVAAIKAVAEVESRGDGFLPTGDPKILFERHIFSKRTKGLFDKLFPDISNPVPGGYGKESDQHKRLFKATTLAREAALESASWGKFQVMGFNYKAAGYKTLQAFINAAYNSEADHLNMFVNFVISNNLAGFIRAKNWSAFARGYNGPDYKKNNYDVKMAEAYKKYSK